MAHIYFALDNLAFRGKAVVPKIEGMISIEKTFEFSNVAAILVMTSDGGTACPANFRWLFVTKDSYKLSNDFGTCSDLYKAEFKGGKLVVTMSGFVGPYNSKAEQRKAAAMRHVYTYTPQKITESTYRAKGPWKQ